MGCPCGSIKKKTHKSTEAQPSKSSKIFIETITWHRDSHGLFDYELKNVTRESFVITKSGKFVRKSSNEISFLEENNIFEPGNLVHVSYKEGNVLLTQAFSSEEEESKYKDDPEFIGPNSIWNVVNQYKQTGYKLNEGDFVKLGRVRFKIKELRLKNDEPNGVNPEMANSNALGDFIKQNVSNQATKKLDFVRKSSKVSESSGGIVCRVCLCEEEEDNPLISPCKCSGSMQYIHIQCLQKWLSNRLNSKTTNYSVSFTLKNFECELCKAIFPASFNINGKVHDSIEIRKFEPPYLVFEILSKEKKLTRGIHVINLKNRSIIKLGRGHEADIRISDISVSRLHAVIRLETNGLFLEDKDSKFGSLVLCKKGVLLDKSHPSFNVQIGKSLFQLSNSEKSLTDFALAVGLPGPSLVAENAINPRRPIYNQERRPDSRTNRRPSNNQPPQPSQPHQPQPIAIPEDVRLEPPRPPSVSGSRRSSMMSERNLNEEGLIPSIPPSILLAETGVFRNRNAPLSAPLPAPINNESPPDFERRVFLEPLNRPTIADRSEISPVRIDDILSDRQVEEEGNDQVPEEPRPNIAEVGHFPVPVPIEEEEAAEISIDSDAEIEF